MNIYVGDNSTEVCDETIKQQIINIIDLNFSKKIDRRDVSQLKEGYFLDMATRDAKLGILQKIGDFVKVDNNDHPDGGKVFTASIHLPYIKGYVIRGLEETVSSLKKERQGLKVQLNHLEKVAEKRMQIIEYEHLPFWRKWFTESPQR